MFLCEPCFLWVKLLPWQFEWTQEREKISPLQLMKMNMYSLMLSLFVCLFFQTEYRSFLELFFDKLTNTTEQIQLDSDKI